jgi:hypothetical protein
LKMKWFDGPPKHESVKKAVKEAQPKAKTKRPTRKAGKP